LSSESFSAPVNASGIIATNIDHGAYSSALGYVIQGTAAAQAMSWTQADDDWSLSVASFKQVAEEEATHFLSTLGVGT
jgi:hypothetical protein